MDGASAAAASSVCDYDESHPRKEIPTMVNAFFDPSTSNTNPSPEPSFVPSLEEKCYTSGFNDDSMQGIEKQMAPFVGGKVNLSRLNVSDDDESEPPKYKSAMMVASGYDNYSLTSNSRNSSPDMNHVDDDCFSSGYSDGFNDEFIQAVKKPFVSEKEPLSALAAEFESGNSIILEKIQLLGEKYTALRRTRGDGNCFYRSFMFSYLEHILVTHNKAEVERVMFCIEKCKMDLLNLGYPKLTYEVFFALFTELLEDCLPGTEAFFRPLRHCLRSDDFRLWHIWLNLIFIADYVTRVLENNQGAAVMFLRFVTSAAIQKRAEFFDPFGLFHKSIVKFCKSSVEQMGEESEEVHIIALCGALGVPIRVVYLNARSSGDPANPNAPNHHDFFPYDQEKVQNNGSNSTDAANVSTDPGPQENRAPFVTLLYRPGHYDILYPM